MSLDSLPGISFCDTDAETVEQSIITIYEKLVGATLYPGDPVRLFLESLAAVIIQQRVLIDQTGKQNLLAYATGDYLDQLGALTDTPRLEAAPATTTVRFSIGSALAYAVVVPAGSRVSPDGHLMFETIGHGEIAAGETYVNIPAQCQTPGAGGNGLLPGQVTKLVDPITHIISVSNTTTTEGGSDIESDDSFRDRIHLAPESFSVAGSVGAYEHWAKTAHPDIVDVAVTSPEPGVVSVYPLLTGGRLPGQEILDLVEASCDPDKVVPLTDTCQAKSPEAVPFSLEITWYLDAGNSAMAATAQASVSTAVDEYVAWQVSALGRDINPTELIHRIRSAGARRVEVSEPVYQAVAAWQVASVTSISLIYGGLEQ